MSKKLSALVIVRDDSSSTMTWSGIPNHIIKILKNNGVDVQVVDNLGFPRHFSWKVKRVLNKFIKSCAPKYYSLDTSKYYGALLEKKISSSKDHDFILAIDFTEGLPFLKSDKPVYVFRDASYLQLYDISYPGYESFSPVDLEELQKVENKAFHQCDRVLITSDWAINYCQKYHPEIPRDKYFVLPFCAQTYPPSTRKDWQLRNIKNSDEVKFLFIGRDWKRKGGNKALAILDELHGQGITVSLTIVGASPELVGCRYKTRVIENLDFDNPVESEKMKNLYKEAHFFILPVNIEAFGIVFSEAMSFGLPIITHDVCALPEIMENGIHGVCLPPNATPDRFASEIVDLIESESGYQEMQENCFRRFEKKFHPDMWVKQLLSLVR